MPKSAQEGRYRNVVPPLSNNSRIVARLCRRDIRLLYIDEAHLHRDMDLGYTWAPEGKPAWRLSGCASLAMNASTGMAPTISPAASVSSVTRAHQAHTIEVAYTTLPLGWVMSLVRSYSSGTAPRGTRPSVCKRRLRNWASRWSLCQADSPDLNPIEGLWKWMREEVTPQFLSCLHAPSL